MISKAEDLVPALTAILTSGPWWQRQRAAQDILAVLHRLIVPPSAGPVSHRGIDWLAVLIYG